MAIVRAATSPFEPLFARFAGTIPQAYLRTLAYKESSFRPDNVHPQSHATGLFQITQPALKGFNTARKARLSLDHLKNPALNTEVAVHHLSNVVAAYRRVPALEPDWSSRRWVELVTLGWNAGHNAVIALVRKMARAGIAPDRITAESVSALARATGKAKYVAAPDRVAWSKSVADIFLNGGAVPAAGASRGEPLVASMLPAPAGGGGTLAIVFGFAAAGLAMVLGTKEHAHDVARKIA